MDFLFFISGAILVLVSVVFGYTMGERKNEPLKVKEDKDA